MSGEGAPELTVPAAEGLRVAVVGTRWHPVITDALVEQAEAAVRESGAELETHRVAGALELGVVCQALARGGCDAVIAVGLVLRGGTPHFDYVCESFTAALTRVSLDEATPVGNGVLTCDTEDQAIARSGLPGSKENKGREAAVAAIEAALLLRSLG